METTGMYSECRRTVFYCRYVIGGVQKVGAPCQSFGNSAFLYGGLKHGGLIWGSLFILEGPLRGEWTWLTWQTSLISSWEAFISYIDMIKVHYFWGKKKYVASISQNRSNLMLQNCSDYYYILHQQSLVLKSECLGILWGGVACGKVR